jgi:GT2 family glycosyltransferase
MKLSINILTWNSESVIEKCIIHCLKQNLKDFEVVVIDNCSNDKTIEICEKYSSNIKIIKNDYNKGYSGGHNTGIKLSNAEYILVLNPDVFIEPDYAINIVNFLDHHLDYGAGIGKILQTKGANIPNNTPLHLIDTMGLRLLKSRQFRARNFGISEKNVSNKPEDVFGVDGMAALYRRKMLEDIKINDEYFDEIFFAYCEDHDLSWRARLLGWNFVCIPTSIAYHIRTWKPVSLKDRKNISKENRRRALRNHYLTILKNDFPSYFIKHFSFILFRFSKIFIYSLLFEGNTLLAYVDIFKCLKQTLIKRKIIFSRKHAKNIEFEKWLSLR